MSNLSIRLEMDKFICVGEIKVGKKEEIKAKKVIGGNSCVKYGWGKKVES